MANQVSGDSMGKVVHGGAHLHSAFRFPLDVLDLLPTCPNHQLHLVLRYLNRGESSSDISNNPASIKFKNAFPFLPKAPFPGGLQYFSFPIEIVPAYRQEIACNAVACIMNLSLISTQVSDECLHWKSAEQLQYEHIAEFPFLL